MNVDAITGSRRPVPIGWPHISLQVRCWPKDDGLGLSWGWDSGGGEECVCVEPPRASVCQSLEPAGTGLRLGCPFALPLNSPHFSHEQTVSA